MSAETTKNTASEITFAPSLLDQHPLSLVKLFINCLRMRSISVHQKVVKLHIFYIIDAWSKDLNTNITLGNWIGRFN